MHKSILFLKGVPLHNRNVSLWKTAKRCLSQDSENGNSNGNGVNSTVIQQVISDLRLKSEPGFTTIITSCPKSSKSTSSLSQDQLYINTTSGHFVCKKCNKEGQWQDLRDNLMHLKATRRRSSFVCFQDVDNVKPFIQENQQAKDVWNSHIPIGNLQKDVALSVLEVFELEHLSPTVLDKFHVRCDPKKPSVVYPVIVDGKITGIKRLTCPHSTNEEIGVVKESIIPRLSSLGVFGLDIVPSNATEIILTGSEVDAMAVTQETKKPAISLPRGLSTLPQEVLPSLERFKTITLWLGDDIRAWESAKLFAKKLNSKRCNIIRPSVEEPGPSTALNQGLKLSNILNRSRPISHKAIVNFSHLRHEVFSQLMHSDQVAGVKWKRYPVLNRLLKGHRRGELTVFTGPTGSGKTTFISDYSLDLCMQGVSTLWGSFEINNVRLGKMMLTQFAQQNISKRMDLFDHYADQLQMLPVYFMTFHGQESIKNVIDAMTHAVYVHDIAHVIVDNLQFMMGTGGNDFGDRFMKQDSMIAAFRKFATNMNCHVTLVIHPRKEKETEDLTTSSVFGTAKATQEADNVLILQDRRLTSVRGRKYLQITKNRFDGELGLMLLKFDKETLSFATKEKEKDSSGGKEKDKQVGTKRDETADESQMQEHSQIQNTSTSAVPTFLMSSLASDSNVKDEENLNSNNNSLSPKVEVEYGVDIDNITDDIVVEEEENDDDEL